MADNRPLSGLKILLLEDELFISSALREHLMQAGAEVVETASSVAAAEASLGEIAFDAAILDIVLPDGDTRELASRLAADDVRIVFHSGHLRPDWLAVTAPDAVFLQKPSDADALVAALADERHGS